MDDIIIWIIIVVFYAPLHFMLPILYLFIVGEETEAVRKQLVRHAVIDAAISMIIAFVLALLLVQNKQIEFAMVVLVLFMFAPFIRIILKRRVFMKH